MPKTRALQLDACRLDEAHTQIILFVSSTPAAARCPAYNVPARHVHRHYTRTLAELPWSGYKVTWQLCVRKLFCPNRKCPRRIFTERLPGIVAPWARRTLRLTTRLLAIGLALGGAAGVRLSQSLGLMVSRNTLLRVIRRAPCPVMVPPRVLSVDDFALRRRHTYGTLRVDLERRRPLALLPDREVATVAQGLQAHPGGEVLVRDRVEAYAEAARRGAPMARQVVDRFHRLQNLTAVLTQGFTAHATQRAHLNAQRTTEPARLHDPAGVAVAPERPAVPLAPQQPSTAAAELAHQRWAHYQQVWT